MSTDQDALLHRTRILKTGFYDVGRYLSIETPEEIQYFERLAKPGTELILERDYGDVEAKPWLIRVLFPFDHRLLGYVTYYKSETAARLMDEGMKVKRGYTVSI